MQASRLSQGASLLHDAPAAPDAAVAPSKEAALAVNQALDAEPPTLCLQLDSTTQPELLPLQDPTPMVTQPDTVQHTPLKLQHVPAELRHKVSGRHELRRMVFATPATGAHNSMDCLPPYCIVLMYAHCVSDCRSVKI